MDKLILIGALPSSLLNFRGDLIRNFKHCGMIVTAMASGGTSQEIESIESLGICYQDFTVARNGLNPIHDAKTFFSLYFFLKRESPKCVFAYTIKPVIWGGIASRLSKVPNFIGLITGLGYAFQSGGLLKNILVSLVCFLYKTALKNAKAVIFQNSDNMQVFIDKGIVPIEKCHLVNGSGVDLSYYKVSTLPSKPHFLLIARLLGDKGIREYAESALLVKKKYPDAVFELVGPEDPSPDGINMDEINNWCDKGALIYSGSTNDVRPFIGQCSIYVLPSYHEGMPRTVLEAMAMGRPILTTDVPGCRETVANGENGWLVEKANVEQLTERMIWFIENSYKWAEMGKKSYQMAKEKFDVHKVNEKILKVMGLSDEKNV